MVAEDLTQVGDRGRDLGPRASREGTDCEASNCDRWFVVSEPIEKGGQDSQRADQGGVAGVVVIANREGDLVDRG